MAHPAADVHPGVPEPQRQRELPSAQPGPRAGRSQSPPAQRWAARTETSRRATRTWKGACESVRDIGGSSKAGRPNDSHRSAAGVCPTAPTPPTVSRRRACVIATVEAAARCGHRGRAAARRPPRTRRPRPAYVAPTKRRPSSCPSSTPRIRRSTAARRHPPHHTSSIACGTAAGSSSTDAVPPHVDSPRTGYDGRRSHHYARTSASRNYAADTRLGSSAGQDFKKGTGFRHAA